MLLPRAKGHSPEAPPCHCHAFSGRKGCRHPVANLGYTLFSSSYAREEEEGRRASEIAFHGVEVLGTMQQEHPQTSLPSPCEFLSIRGPQGVGLFKGGDTRGQVSPVIRLCTYHKGAIGSSSGNAAGRWRDCTGRGWEKAYGSQVQARDEMRLQLGKEGKEDVSSIRWGLVVPCVWHWLNQEDKYPQREWAKHRRITRFYTNTCLLFWFSFTLTYIPRVWSCE